MLWLEDASGALLFEMGCYFKSDCPCKGTNGNTEKCGCTCDQCNGSRPHNNCKCTKDPSGYGKCQPNSFSVILSALIILTVFVLAIAYPFHNFPDKLASNLKSAFNG